MASTAPIEKPAGVPGAGADGPQNDGGGSGGQAGSVGGSGGTQSPTSTCPTISTADGQFAPCGRTAAIAYSPDGRFLATGTDFGQPDVHIWRLSDGALFRDIDGISGRTLGVAFSPDSQTLAVTGEKSSSGDAGIAKLFDVASGALLRTFPVTCGFYAASASFSKDGTLLATSGYMGAVEIWRVSDGALVTRIPYATSVHNVHFSPAGNQVIGGGVDRRATVWNVPDGTLALTLNGIADEMADASFSPGGQQIASTGLNNDIRVWDAATGALLQTLPAHTAYVSHVVWVDQDRFITNDWSGAVKSWTRATSGSFAVDRVWSTGGQSLGIAVSPDKTKLAVGGASPASDGFVFLAL